MYETQQLQKSPRYMDLLPLLGAQSMVLTEGHVWKAQRDAFNPGFASAFLRDAVPQFVACTQVRACRCAWGWPALERARRQTPPQRTVVCARTACHPNVSSSWDSLCECFHPPAPALQHLVDRLELAADEAEAAAAGTAPSSGAAAAPGAGDGPGVVLIHHLVILLVGRRRLRWLLRVCWCWSNRAACAPGLTGSDSDATTRPSPTRTPPLCA